MFLGIHIVCQKFRNPNWIDYQLTRGKRVNPKLSQVLI